MNILIIGERSFSRILGNKLKLSHHYNNHFIITESEENQDLEHVLSIALDNENEIINFCVQEKIDVIVLAHKFYLNNNFYERLKSNSFLNRTIIVGVAPSAIQKLNNITNNEVEEYTDQIVVLTDGKNYKILNEKNEHYLEKIEQQIIQKIKGIEINISGFICFNVLENDENFELSSIQFIMNDNVATNIFERLETDVLSLFAAMDNGTLEDVNIEFYDKK